VDYLEEPKIFTITEVTGIIKQIFDENFNNISITGEISNFKKHTSGHIYFTLKDEGAQISAVIWRSLANSIRMNMQDGMKVIVKGNISVYEPQGKYQIIITSVRLLSDKGELQEAFEKLKKKLDAEGLFDEEHKKPLPEYPKAIGIVTSATGAAIRDMVSVIGTRYPIVDLILCPVNVQGAGAAEEIARAISLFNEYKKVDILIVGRGGGSLEDLWPFNEEIVARSIYDSDIPVISAVGHQIDFTISDFVADVRAATPSNAGEIAVPDKEELESNLIDLRNELYTGIKRKISDYRNRVLGLINSYSFNKPRDILRKYQQKVDDLISRLETGAFHRVEMYKEKFSSLEKQLLSVNPNSVLKRGYAIIEKNDTVVASYAELYKDDEIKINFHDGIKEGRII
jgi:exodeoxyribonuclease VII large subunit